MDKVLFTQLSIRELRTIIREEQFITNKAFFKHIKEEQNSIPKDEIDKYLNKKEAASIANVCTSTIDNWIRAGFIKKYKFGDAVRIKLSNLINYLETLAA